MSATSDKEIIQGIVTEIMNARSAGSVTNTMVAQVLRYCVDTLGGRIEDLEGKDESEAIESLAEIAAFLAGITDSQTLSGILSGLRSDLHGEVVAESEARQAADTALDGRITTISEYLTQGYSYGGIASVSGTPGSGRKFYFAVAAGTYTNYGGLTVGNEIAVLKYDGTNWSKDVVFTIDNTPTAASVNPVKSGGVYDFVLGKTLEVVDVANLDTFKAADLRKSDNTQKYLLNYNGRNCGTLHIISDNAGHVVTQIITTHYLYDDSDGTIDWNGHSDNNVVQLYRSVKISGGTLPDNNWTRWNYVNSEVLSLLRIDVDAVAAMLGYFTCDTAAATATKTVASTGYVLSMGGCIKIKMTNANTAASGVTLQIGSAAAKPLYYAGQAVSASNTWQADETVEVYYDGTNYQANNVAGGADDIYIEEGSPSSDLEFSDEQNHVVVKFANGHIKTKNFDSESISNLSTGKFKNKKIAIVGDSISTYAGWLPSDMPGYDGAAYVTYYPHGEVNNVAKTWWYKMATALGLNPDADIINCSWSGSRVTGDSTSTSSASAGCSTRRVTDLAIKGYNPDIIIVFISCNDWGNNVGLGSWAVTDAIPAEGDISYAREAYALMINKIHVAYPNAKVFCCTILDDFSRDKTAGWPSNNNSGVSTYQWNQNIIEVASALGCDIIDFHHCGINYSNIADYYAVDSGLHPNDAGHTLMANKAVSELISKY